jgi:single-strand DNA-binding protein
MSDVNNVVLIGRLTRDAALKSTTNGTAVSKFSIAVNKKRKSGDGFKDEAQFFEVVVWGKMAESLQQYLTKGKQIAVTGELSQERWSGDDGQNHSKVTVTASTIQLLGGGSSNANDNAGQKQEPSSANVNSDEEFVDDIPF